MKNLLLFSLFSLALLFGYINLSSAASLSGDGAYTLYDGDEVRLDNNVWVRPSFSYATQSLVSLVFYTGSVNDGSSQAIVGTNFLSANDSETKELAQGTVTYTVEAINRSSSNPSITVSFVSGSIGTLSVSDLQVKVLTNTFDDGAATFITWDTNFLTTNKIAACEQKNCQNPNIAETVTYNQETGFEWPLYESHMVQHRNLKYSTTYYYKIQGETATGTEIDYPAGSDNWLTFTTGPEPKSSFIPKIGYYQNMVVVEWTTTTNTTAKVLYGKNALDREYSGGITPKKEHKVQISLEYDVTYQLKIVTYNSDNTVNFSNQYQVKIQREENLNKPAEYIEDTKAIQKTAPSQEEPAPTQAPSLTNTELVTRLQGRILLQVEAHGEAWYLEPLSQRRYYLQNGAVAYQALRTFGLGITDGDIEKIPVGLADFYGIDSDNDGVPDDLEDALSTDKDNPDSDGDGFSDGVEIQSGYNPLGSGKLVTDPQMQARLKGRILLQVETRGQAWYVNSLDGKRYYMKDGNAAYQIMRFLSLGITNKDLSSIPTGEL